MNILRKLLNLLTKFNKNKKFYPLNKGIFIFTRIYKLDNYTTNLENYLLDKENKEYKLSYSN